MEETDASGMESGTKGPGVSERRSEIGTRRRGFGQGDKDWNKCPQPGW